MTQRHRLGLIKTALGLSTLPGAAWAHATDQAFVLLLPTDVYMAAGGAAVALTVVALALLPGTLASRLFTSLRLIRLPTTRAPLVTSWLSFAVLAWLVWLGWAGPRDPLVNLLPLTIWTGWWLILLTLHALAFDIWTWVNPWTGPVRAARRLLGPAPLRLPRWTGLAVFLGFAAFLLAHPAPTDPAILARAVALYWLFSFAGHLAFGPRWALRGCGISMMMRAYGRMAMLGKRGGWLCLGLPGWQLLPGGARQLVPALLVLLILGTGSFDGLNETFWWMTRLGVNPLEFPGRSAVVWQTVLGLALSCAALIAVFVGLVRLGLGLAGAGTIPGSIALFAPTLLPIALGYHVAHYLTAVMVEAQYMLSALSDPLARGDDLLGLGTFYVTTGFFNTQDNVRLIYLGQAGAIVVGHMIAVLLAHALAVRHVPRRPGLSQAPLAAFMVLYTLFGLWLLASPRV
ncbi:hypothetical protein [Oceanibium sediminis]|uniref:hypothetical protein n=1 Tax=Oceanibium sediminis TaxID=2026339 RepID=UPI000DD3BF6A|nr:hypothetical protein [Oceanibium sediminis]